MTLWQRSSRKLAYLQQRYLWDGLIAEWLVPTFIPWLFPKQPSLPPDPESVRSVLVWNVDSFGDFLFVTPLLRALRLGYPNARIDLVLNRACLSLAETNPHINRLIPVNAPDYYTGRGYFCKPDELHASGYDIGVIAEMGTRPADAARIMARRIGVTFLAAGDIGLLKSLAQLQLPRNEAEYWPAYFLRLAAGLGLPKVPPTIEVVLTSADRERIAPLLHGNTGRRRIALHPMVASYARTTKKWPDDHFWALACQLHDTHAVEFYLTGSADEAGDCSALAERMQASGLAAQSLAGQLTLRETVALYSRMDAVVTGDTAALHLATAAGARIVSLFGATDERRLVAPGTVVLSESLPCRPCHRVADRAPQWPKCYYDRPWCLHRITPERVANIIKSMVFLATLEERA